MEAKALHKPLPCCKARPSRRCARLRWTASTRIIMMDCMDQRACDGPRREGRRRQHLGADHARRGRRGCPPRLGPVFGVRSSLFGAFERHEPGEPPHGRCGGAAIRALPTTSCSRGRRIVRLGHHELTLVHTTSDNLYDQLIGHPPAPISRALTTLPCARCGPPHTRLTEEER